MMVLSSINSLINTNILLHIYWGGVGGGGGGGVVAEVTLSVSAPGS